MGAVGTIYTLSRTGIWLSPAGTPPEALAGWLNGLAGVEDYTSEYGGAQISVNQLDLGRRVVATYDPRSRSAARITAPAAGQMEDGLARRLLSLAAMGEMSGTVTEVSLQGQARGVYIRDRITGETALFSTTPESQVLVDGLPAPLGPDLAGRMAAIVFEPKSREIIEISTLGSAPGQETVSGVVSRFVSKVFPRNVTILTSQRGLKNLHPRSRHRDPPGRTADLSQRSASGGPGTAQHTASGGSAPGARSWRPGFDLAELKKSRNHPFDRNRDRDRRPVR